MKKILFFSLFLIATTAFTACTADDVPTTNARENLDGDTGGQNGQLPPPPKP